MKKGIFILAMLLSCGCAGTKPNVNVNINYNIDTKVAMPVHRH